MKTIKSLYQKKGFDGADEVVNSWLQQSNYVLQECEKLKDSPPKLAGIIRKLKTEAKRLNDKVTMLGG